MIEQIVELAAKLSRNLFVLDAEREVLHQNGIHVAHRVGTDVRQYGPDVSEGKWRRNRKDTCIEPLVNSGVNELGALAIVDRGPADTDRLTALDP